MSAYGDAISGLAALLKAHVTGLQTHGGAPDDIHQYPAAVILPDPIDLEINLQGNTFEAVLRITLLIASAETPEAWLQLWDYIDPTQTNKSIVAAVRADQTLGGKVDSSDITRIENIGRRQIGGGYQVGADFLLTFIKTVA